MSRVKTEQQFEGQTQQQWLAAKKQELITANMQGDVTATSEVTRQVADIFGDDYSTQWRKHILEEHAQLRMKNTIATDFADELR